MARKRLRGFDSHRVIPGLDNRPTSPESKALVRTLVQLGKDLGLTTLAEGVETTDQLDHLRGEQVTEIQGFLLSRPLDAQAIEARILTPTQLKPHTATRP
jgi:EAL domain-containing protein (putative c-di-GMP-specific phosphodiesterase class I)